VELRVGWEVALRCTLLAFLLSISVAWIYSVTYQGLSYSRSFVLTLALGGIVAAMVMLAIGNDVARGLGLVGALTVIRFRTTMKDTRDLIFAFASLGAGVACGVQAYVVAITGTIVFAGAAAYLSWSGFGARRQFDAVIRFHLPSDPGRDSEAKSVMTRHCRSLVLINLRETSGGVQEHSYHVKFATPDSRSLMVSGLSAVSGLTGLTVLMRDTVVEV